MPRYEKTKIGEIHRLTKVPTFMDRLKGLAMNCAIGIGIWVIIAALVS